MICDHMPAAPGTRARQCQTHTELPSSLSSQQQASNHPFGRHHKSEVEKRERERERERGERGGVEKERGYVREMMLCVGVCVCLCVEWDDAGFGGVVGCCMEGLM